MASPPTHSARLSIHRGESGERIARIYRRLADLKGEVGVFERRVGDRTRFPSAANNWAE